MHFAVLFVKLVFINLGTWDYYYYDEFLLSVAFHEIPHSITTKISTKEVVPYIHRYS